MYNLYNQIELQEDLYQRDDVALLLENKFKFTYKYDMERCEQVVAMDPINWAYVPFGDDEWKFVLHRMDYCISLCIETLKTGNAQYMQKAASLIFDFIEKNNQFSQQSGLRTLDTGIRLITWTKCLNYFKQYNILSDQQCEQISASMQWQTRLLYDNYSQFQHFSNWGLMQAVAVLNVAAGIEVEKEVLDFYETSFLSHLQTQFLSDGMQWEQSSVYVIEVVKRLLQLSNPKYMTSQYYQLLKKSAMAIYALGNYDQRTVLLGDGDRIDTIGIVQHIGYLTQDYQLLSLVVNEKLREEVYFEFGDRAYAFFKNLNIKASNEQSFNLEDCGYLSFKSEGNYLSFQNGNLGGGHGHFDNLHINYSRNKKRILVDSGRYSYVEGYDTREYYKQTSAHNGFELDKSGYQYAGAWATRGKLMLNSIVKKEMANIKYLESSIHDLGISCMRKIIYLPTAELIVIDTCNEQYKINWITDDSATVKQNDDHFQLATDTNLYVFGASTKKEECYISPWYNTRVKTSKIVAKNDDDVVISAFLDKHTKIRQNFEMTYFYGKSSKNCNNSLQVIEIENESYHYLVAHLPYDYGINNKVLHYQNQLLYGSMLVFDVRSNQSYVFKC